MSAGPRPFDGSIVLHAVPLASQPNPHAVDVTDMPSELHVSSMLSLPHVTAPGSHPHWLTGQSGGTIVQTFFALPDGANSPFTSQNGYAGSVQSAFDVH
jgi:hypothetical protein